MFMKPFMQSLSIMPFFDKPLHNAIAPRRISIGSGTKTMFSASNQYRSKYTPHQGAQEIARRKSRTIYPNKTGLKNLARNIFKE